MDQIHSNHVNPPRAEPRPYFGKQDPDYGEGGGFGKHEDEPGYGPFGGQPGGRGPVDPTAPEHSPSADHDRPQHKNFAQHGEGGKFEGGESTGGYADHRRKLD